MPCVSWYHDGIIIMDISDKVEMFLCLTHLDNTLPLLDAKELFKMRMFFQSDILPRLKAHQRDLQVFPRP